MPLNQSKPPLSFILYPAFCLFFPLFLPPSLGHWCQTDLLCAGVCFCSSMPVCICTDECMCGCAAASQDVRFIWCVCMYVSMFSFLLHMCSFMHKVLDPQPCVLSCLSLLSAAPERPFFSSFFLFYIGIDTLIVVGRELFNIL